MSEDKDKKTVVIDSCTDFLAYLWVTLCKLPRSVVSILK